MRSGGRDLPSPVLTSDVLFVINMGGIATAYDPMSGKPVWKQRLSGQFSASPVAAGGLIYASAENGDVYVVKGSDKYELVSRNKVDPADDEVFRSSLAISDGQLFLRSNKRLYCIGRRGGR